jgi:hypothetical protein
MKYNKTTKRNEKGKTGRINTHSDLVCHSYRERCLYRLYAWSRVLLEKIVLTELIKKFLVLRYQKFMAVFIRVLRHPHSIECNKT